MITMLIAWLLKRPLILIPLVAIVVGGPALKVGTFIGAHQERSQIELKAAHEALKRYQRMEKNNAEFNSLPEHERCIAFMRDSGLPEHECD